MLAEVTSQPQATYLIVPLHEPENHLPRVIDIAVVNDQEFRVIGEPVAADNPLYKAREGGRGAECRDDHRYIN